MLLKKSRRFLLLSVTLHRRDGCHRLVSHAGHAASSSTCAGKACALQAARASAASPPKNKFRLMSLFRTRLVAQSATARFGTHHSRRLSCALSGGISTEPDFRLGSVQRAMGHEQCLYRSNAVRQGTVVLLLKIFNGGDEKLIAFLSHSEAFAAILLEVGRMRPATAVKLGVLAASLSQEELRARHCGIVAPLRPFFFIAIL